MLYRRGWHWQKRDRCLVRWQQVNVCHCADLLSSSACLLQGPYLTGDKIMVGCMSTEGCFTVIDSCMNGPFDWSLHSNFYSLAGHNLLLRASCLNCSKLALWSLLCNAVSLRMVRIAEWSVRQVRLHLSWSVNRACQYCDGWPWGKPNGWYQWLCI